MGHSVAANCLTGSTTQHVQQPLTVRQIECCHTLLCNLLPLHSQRRYSTLKPVTRSLRHNELLTQVTQMSWHARQTYPAPPMSDSEHQLAPLSTSSNAPAETRHHQQPSTGICTVVLNGRNISLMPSSRSREVEYTSREPATDRPTPQQQQHTNTTNSIKKRTHPLNTTQWVEPDSADMQHLHPDVE